MKAIQVTLLIINHDEVPSDEIKYLIEHARYPNHCLAPIIMDFKEADIGEWDVNKKAAMLAEYERLFKR